MTLPGRRLFAQPLAPWERDGLKAALVRSGLPAADIGEPDRFFWRFEQDDIPVGFGGLEVHGDQALLRSLVTLPPLRHRGIGRALAEILETEAAARGARAIYVLTTSEQDFFANLGYAKCDRTRVPAAIRTTAQFASLCPATATVMMKRL